MSTAVERKTIVAPFGIEADDDRNADLMIANIDGGLRLRSRQTATRTARHPKTGEQVIPKDQVSVSGQLPETPGMQLHVNPATLSYKVIDPLHGDDELCERLCRGLNELGGMHRPQTIRGVPPSGGTLDKHAMKTLCREILWFLESKGARVVKGPVPKKEDIDELPGDYLLDSGVENLCSRPKFEKDLEAWKDSMSRVGG